VGKVVQRSVLCVRMISKVGEGLRGAEKRSGRLEDRQFFFTYSQKGNYPKEA